MCMLCVDLLHLSSGAELGQINAQKMRTGLQANSTHRAQRVQERELR